MTEDHDVFRPAEYEPAEYRPAGLAPAEFAPEAAPAGSAPAEFAPAEYARAEYAPGGNGSQRNVEPPTAPATPPMAPATPPIAPATPPVAPAMPMSPATPPVAPAMPPADVEALYQVVAGRRDVRNGFRPDPIADDVLTRVLTAAHQAPSVGLSQPWDFIVVRDRAARERVHALARTQREVFAAGLPAPRARAFRDLKVEAILDTPLNIVVTCDPTRGGRHVLGRHAQPQVAAYSTACAVQNFWLAARAEGLGVGWVSFFDERELAATLGLPAHLDVVAYLCVGHVEAFPPAPELVLSGWARRRPLAWAVHDGQWGRRGLPGAPPASLVADTIAAIGPLDAAAVAQARERQEALTKPSGSLGRAGARVGTARRPGRGVPAAVARARRRRGIRRPTTGCTPRASSPWPQEVTAQMVANFLASGAVVNAIATQAGAEVCVVDVGVAADLPAAPGLLPRKIRPGTADMTDGPGHDP